MTSHNKTSERQKWIQIKAKIIARFGTIRSAARHIGCHPNAIRYTATGRCPRVAARLKQAL